MILKKFFKFLQERNFSLKYRPAYYRKVIHLFVLCLITSCCQHKICSLEKSWPAPYSLRHAGLLRWASVCAKSVVFGFSKWKSQKERKKSSKWMYITICLTETKLNGLPGNFTINWKAKFVSYQTFTRPEVFVICISYTSMFYFSDTVLSSCLSLTLWILNWFNDKLNSLCIFKIFGLLLWTRRVIKVSTYLNT